MLRRQCFNYCCDKIVVMKTMRSSRDLTKGDILHILERTKAYENDRGNSLKGKILGILNFRESLRSTASLKSSILRAGGDYITLDASYVTSGEEKMEDTVRAVSDLVDILAIRTPMTIPIDDLKAEVPIINFMSGDEHTLAVLWFFYSLMKMGKKLEGMKVGVYGQVRYSQPTIGLYRMGAKLGMHFYEDSVVKEIGASEELQTEIKKLGGNWERKSREEFKDRVDLMWISEGRPGEGASKEVLDKFLKEYRSITKKIMKESNADCCWYFDEPRTLPDGRVTAEKGVDDHPYCLNKPVMKESLAVNMAVFEWILGL
jgi:ornithine carbamoyltransferase